MRRRLTDGQIVLRSMTAMVFGLICTAIALIVPMIIGEMLCSFFCGLGPDDFNPYRMFGFLIGFVLACPMALIGLYHTARPWFYPYVATKAGYYCQQCGYNLRGLGAETRDCPECGQAIPDTN